MNDLVVKSQVIDIIDVTLQLIRRPHVVQTSSCNSKSRCEPLSTSEAHRFTTKSDGMWSFLIEIGTTLLEEGVSNTFGIATSHSPVIPKEGESWQETSDHDNRVLKLILDVWKPTVEEEAHSVQTIYRVSDVMQLAAQPPTPQPAPPEPQPARVNCTGHHICTWCCQMHHCVKHQICRAHPRPRPA
jgi:hypothetical protein